MFKFDINKPPKKYKFMVYFIDVFCNRGASGSVLNHLYIQQTVKKPDDFTYKHCKSESDTEEIAKIVKVFDTNREAEEYITKMENLSKCDWQKYLETLTQDRKSFLVENNKKIRLYPNGTEIIL